MPRKRKPRDLVIVQPIERVRGNRRILFCGNEEGCRRTRHGCWSETRALVSTFPEGRFSPSFTCFCPRCGALNVIDMEAVRGMQREKS